MASDPSRTREERMVQRARFTTAALLPLVGHISGNPPTLYFHPHDKVTELVLSGWPLPSGKLCKQLLSDISIAMICVEDFSGPLWELKNVQLVTQNGSEARIKACDNKLDLAEKVAHRLSELFKLQKNPSEPLATQSLVDYVVQFATSLLDMGRTLGKGLEEYMRVVPYSDIHEYLKKMVELCPRFVTDGKTQSEAYNVKKANNSVWRGKAEEHINQLCKDRAGMVRLNVVLLTSRLQFEMSQGKPVGAPVSAGGLHSEELRTLFTPQHPAQRYTIDNQVNGTHGTPNFGAPERADTPAPQYEGALEHASRHIHFREGILSGFLSLRGRRIYGMKRGAVSEW